VIFAANSFKYGLEVYPAVGTDKGAKVRDVILSPRSIQTHTHTHTHRHTHTHTHTHTPTQRSPLSTGPSTYNPLFLSHTHTHTHTDTHTHTHSHRHTHT